MYQNVRRPPSPTDNLVLGGVRDGHSYAWEFDGVDAAHGDVNVSPLISHPDGVPRELKCTGVAEGMPLEALVVWDGNPKAAIPKGI